MTRQLCCLVRCKIDSRVLWPGTTLPHRQFFNRIQISEMDHWLHNRSPFWYKYLLSKDMISVIKTRKLPDHLEIETTHRWLFLRLHGAVSISDRMSSKQYTHLNNQSLDFESLRDSTVRHHIGHLNRLPVARIVCTMLHFVSFWWHPERLLEVAGVVERQKHAKWAPSISCVAMIRQCQERRRHPGWNRYNTKTLMHYRIFSFQRKDDT